MLGPLGTVFQPFQSHPPLTAADKRGPVTALKAPAQPFKATLDVMEQGGREHDDGNPPPRESFSKGRIHPERCGGILAMLQIRCLVRWTRSARRLHHIQSDPPSAFWRYAITEAGPVLALESRT